MKRYGKLLFVLLILAAWPWVLREDVQAEGADVQTQGTAVSISPLLTGYIRDAQAQPVLHAHVTAYAENTVLA